MSQLPFDWFVLLLRVVFIFLLYFFLFQVIRVILRELKAFSSDPRHARGARGTEPSGHLLVKAPGNSGLRTGARLDLEPVTVIGRHPRATIRIDDEFVSSEHAQLTWNDNGWWMTDLDSTNGTILNGKEISVPISMKYGDLIEIGDVKLQLAP